MGLFRSTFNWLTRTPQGLFVSGAIYTGLVAAVAASDVSQTKKYGKLCYEKGLLDGDRLSKSGVDIKKVNTAVDTVGLFSLPTYYPNVPFKVKEDDSAQNTSPIIATEKSVDSLIKEGDLL